MGDKSLQEMTQAKSGKAICQKISKKKNSPKVKASLWLSQTFWGLLSISDEVQEAQKMRPGGYVSNLKFQPGL